MLLSLLVPFYFALGATALGNHSDVVHEARLSVVHSTQYQDPYLTRRQADATLTLQFGVLLYPQAYFYGTSQLYPSASADNPITLGASNSFVIYGYAYAILTSSDKSTTIIIWDSVPNFYFLSLPGSPGTTYSITSIQSAVCSPSCTSAGTCDKYSPVCICPKGFTGAQCQSCAKGFFGPTCQACPSNCKTCDDGMSGSGLCLVPASTTPKCKCENAICGGSNGEGACTCLPGWGPANNGTACAQCLQGFYLASNGGCQTCQLACSSCDDITGNCIKCQDGYTKSSTDKTKCLPDTNSNTPAGQCPEGSYYNGNSNSPCSKCSPVCKSCRGSSSNSCDICADGLAMYNNNCVEAPNGICDSKGTGGVMMIVDNNKHKCEGCGAAIDPACVECQYTDFTAASLITNALCTKCLIGFFLWLGRCVAICPVGSFPSLNPAICTKCTPPCGSCAEAPDQCLSCTGGLVLIVSSGKCVATCPPGTFVSGDKCISCHADCKTCKGPNFTDCLSCPDNRPILDPSGQCLDISACGQTQYYNKKQMKCSNCHNSCSSCFDYGIGFCLACGDQHSILINSTCMPVAQAADPSAIPS